MTQACMSHRERIFKSKSKIWPQMTPFDIWPSKVSMPNSSIPKESIGAKNLLKMVTCVRHISRKFQFCKSIFSKFWIFLDLETKILINFSTPKNPYITFLDRSRNTQKSRCSFSFNPPNIQNLYSKKTPAQRSVEGTGQNGQLCLVANFFLLSCVGWGGGMKQ